MKWETRGGKKDLLVVVVELVSSLWSARLLIDGTSVECGDAVVSGVRVVVTARRVLAEHALDHGLVLVDIDVYEVSVDGVKELEAEMEEGMRLWVRIQADGVRRCPTTHLFSLLIILCALSLYSARTDSSSLLPSSSPSSSSSS